MTRPALSVLIVVALLAGCAILGIQPNTLNERLAVAYAAHNALLTSAATSVDSDALTATEGEQVLRLADHSRQLLDAAHTASTAGDSSTADAKFKLAVAILDELRDYLHARRRQP